MPIFGTIKSSTGFVLKILIVLFLMIELIVIATYFLAAPLGLSLLFGSSDGAAYAEHYVRLYVLVFLLPFRLPVATNIGVLFSELMLVYTVCLVGSWLLDPSLQRTVRDMLSVSPLRIFRNWILAMPLISNMLLMIIILLQSLQEAGGIHTGGITFTSPFETLTELAYSPILEEVGFRITPIGTFLAIQAFMIWRARRFSNYPVSLSRMLILSILVPERFRKFAGLRTIENNGILKGIGLPGWIVILLTSLAFGLAHFLSGSGWQVGKISSAFVAGFALSLVYWRYGAHAATLLHWFFNYYSYVYQLASDTYAHAFSTLLYLIQDAAIWLGILGGLSLLLMLVLRIRAGNQEKV